MQEHVTQDAIPTSCRIIDHGKYRGWVEMPRFALVDQHTYYDEVPETDENGEIVKDAAGKIKYKVVPIDLDEKELHRIAETCNNRTYADHGTGDYCPVALGHTKDGLPTKFQPGLAGFIKDYAVEPFINDVTGKPVIDVDTGKPKLAIYATPFAERKNLEAFQAHPRRSIELRFREGTIDPLSLLSSETPARDLGLHKFSAVDAPEREKPYRYSIRDSKQVPEQKVMANPNEDATGKSLSEESKVANMVFEDARWKEMESTLKDLKAFLTQVSGEGAGAEGDMAGGAPPAGGPASAGIEPDLGAGAEGDDAHGDLLGAAGSQPHDDANSFSEDEPYDMTMDEPEGDGNKEKPHKSAAYCIDEDAHKAKMSASYSAPGVGAVSMPNFEGKHKMSANAAGLEQPIKEAKDRQQAAKFAKLEQRLAAVEAENKTLREKNEVSELQAVLAGLDAEGVDYDAGYEIPRLMKMSKDEQTKHMDYMRTKYGKTVPGGGKPIVPNEQQAPQRFSKADRTVAVESTDGLEHADAAEVARTMLRTNLKKDEAVAKLRGVDTSAAVKVR